MGLMYHFLWLHPNDALAQERVQALRDLLTAAVPWHTVHHI